VLDRAENFDPEKMEGPLVDFQVLAEAYNAGRVTESRLSPLLPGQGYPNSILTFVVDNRVYRATVYVDSVLGVMKAPVQALLVKPESEARYVAFSSNEEDPKAKVDFFDTDEELRAFCLRELRRYHGSSRNFASLTLPELIRETIRAGEAIVGETAGYGVTAIIRGQRLEHAV